MKKFYLVATMMLVATITWSQTYTWIGANGASWGTQTNWSPQRAIPSVTDTLVFDAGNTRSIAAVPTQTVASIRISNNTNITLQGAGATQTLTIGGATGDDLIIASGTLTQAATLENIVMAASATANISGTYTVNGTFNLTNANVVATVNGALDNRNSITGATATKLQINGTYFHGINGGTVPTASWNANSVCNISGMTNAFPAGMNQAFVDITISGALSGTTELTSNLACTGDFTYSATGSALRITNTTTDRTMTVGGNFSMTAGAFTVVSDDGDGTLNVTGNFSLSGGTFTMKEEDGAATLNITGNFSQSGGVFDQRTDLTGVAPVVTVTGDFTLTNGTYDISGIAASGTLNIAGDYTQGGGTLTETSTSNGTVNFNGTAEQTFSKTAGTISNAVNFAISSGAIVNFGTSVLNGSTGTFTLNAGGKIITSNNNGLGATGSIQVTGAKTYNSGADYEFRGTSTGTFTTTTNPQVRDLTINNPTGNVTLAQPMTVDRAFALSNGLLITTANLLTINTAGTSTVATATSFVDGPMAKVGTAAFMFPVGKSGQGYRNIGITAPSTSSTFRAEFFKDAPPAGALGAGLTQRSLCEYWDLTRTAGTGSAQVILSWEAGSTCNATMYVTDLPSLRVAHFTGGTWVDEGNESTTGTTSSGTITSGNILSTFSPFTLASAVVSQNPLPVMFANVRAYEKNDGIQIEWSNLTERDLIKYIVEHSTDGRAYSTLSEKLPARNTNDRADYTEFDASPASGANFYRIKVLEIGGKIIFSKVLRVEKGNSKQSFSMYPNPVAGNDVTVSLAGVRQGQYNVRVITSAGQDVYQKALTVHGSSVTQTLTLPNVKPGVYTMLVTGDSYTETKIFIVQ